MSTASATIPGTFTRWPQTDEELWWFIKTLFGVSIPNRSVCPGHSNPFAALAEAYFARAPIAVWHGSRGLAGKSFTLAMLGTLEAIRYGCGVNILGGSGEQSKNVLDIMAELWNFRRAPRHLLTSDPEGHVQIRLENGGWIKALKASSKSVRGPHPQRLRLDEVDEIPLNIFDAAMGQTLGKDGVPAQTVCSSTRQYPDGTMTEVMKRAAERGWPMHEWCYKESMAKPHGWLSQAEVERKRGEVSEIMWRVEYELQEPSPEDRAIDPECVTEMFWRELGEFEGYPGQLIKLEDPELDEEGEVVGDYAAGADWARKQDFTEVKVFRFDVVPVQLVASYRDRRKPWPVMTTKFDELIKLYGARALHDATGLGDVVEELLTEPAQGFEMVGRPRKVLLSEYIKAIESKEICSPYIRTMEAEHRYATVDDVYGTGHLPDSIAAGALAWRAGQEDSGVTVR